MNRLLKELTEENIEKIRHTKKDDLIDLHFGLGMWIRNNFGLWKENFELLSDCAKQSGQSMPSHEDDASTIIIEALWERLQIKISDRAGLFN